MTSLIAQSWLQTTWPADQVRHEAGFLLRRSSSGGLAAASALLQDADWSVERAENAMRAWDQHPIFEIWPENAPHHAALDVDLERRGYRRSASWHLLEGDAADIALEQCEEHTIFCEAILACIEEIWAASAPDLSPYAPLIEGPNSPARLPTAPMERAVPPKTWILGRQGDTPSGCAFVAVADTTAVLRALAVLELARRQGLGHRMVRAGAAWAVAQGARRFATILQEENRPARALFSALGMTATGRFHYRIAP
ncbi:MAG: GNAT family N-acetyltransferase [Pseudomonadota bacterium]